MLAQPPALKGARWRMSSFASAMRLRQRAPFRAGGCASKLPIDLPVQLPEYRRGRSQLTGDIGLGLFAHFANGGGRNVPAKWIPVLFGVQHEAGVLETERIFFALQRAANQLVEAHAVAVPGIEEPFDWLGKEAERTNRAFIFRSRVVGQKKQIVSYRPAELTGLGCCPASGYR